MHHLFRLLFRKCDGATAIEYGLIAALIGIACIAVFRLVGGQLNCTLYAISFSMAGNITFCN